jgi:hypothetical protein
LLAAVAAVFVATQLILQAEPVAQAGAGTVLALAQKEVLETEHLGQQIAAVGQDLVSLVLLVDLGL